MRRLTLRVSGCSGCWRAKASSCWVSVAPRSTRGACCRRFWCRCRRRVPWQHFEAAGQHRQQVVEVVRDAAGQLADRFHFLRLEQRRIRLGQRGVGLLLLGQVARDLGKADQLAHVVVDGVDDDVGPEAGAVLAHAPALGFVAAFARGGAERACRPALDPVFLGIEARKMLAHDLVGLVALDALGADVPVADRALGREHVDRVIGHALHQQPEALLAGAQRLLGLAFVGDVARDLGVAEQRPLLVVDRVDHDAGPEARAVLAHAPAFGLVLALVQGGRQGALGQVRRPVFGGVETREVLAQDFGRQVALEALGARIPAADVAFGVEHVDRIVADARDQILEALLVGQLLPGGYSIVHVLTVDVGEVTLHDKPKSPWPATPSSPTGPRLYTMVKRRSPQKHAHSCRSRHRKGSLKCALPALVFRARITLL
jgi:hypothetical protein